MHPTFQGRAKRLDDIDLPRIGARIGVGEDELHAFLEVESRGSGFDKKGRPAMLFEPHLFHRELRHNAAKLAKATAEGLAYPKWRSGNYPSDSYPRLFKAMAIDQAAALRSASWGLGQILGSNHRAAGYETPQDMVRAFMDDEETHLAAMVAFLKANKLDDDLRAHRWTALARGYNGPGYATHNYHGRLAAAYAKWSRIKDTPWSADDAVNETVEADPVPNVVFAPPAKNAEAPAKVPDALKKDEPTPEPADEKPWWERSPVLRQLVNTLSALGISAAAVLDLPPWLIALLAVLVAGVSMYALAYQAKRPS
jgi:hypothetical protein